MKKAAIIFCFATFSSLFAAASSELSDQQGDPKKEQKKETSTSWAQGYFNIFNIFFVATPPPSDTTKVKSSVLITGDGKKNG